jgi:hypothetical protein
MLLLLAACAGPGDKPADDADTDTADTGTPPAPTVTLGEACPLAERIGEVALRGQGGSAYVQGRIYDKPDPWIGAPAASTATCDFHQFSTTSCGTCDPGEVCGFDGACVPERRVVPATLTVMRDDATLTFDADATTGDLYGAAGPEDAAYTLTLTVGAQTAELPATDLRLGLGGLTVLGEGDSMAPTALTATWTPTGGGRVRTVIPINHHAAGPTFTRCDVSGETGTFAADAGMLAPLAVVTGLEFQAVEVDNTAAVRFVDGCVDVRLGVLLYTSVEWSAE